MRNLLVALLLAACSPATIPPPDVAHLDAAPDLAVPESWLVGHRVCVEATGYGWITIWTHQPGAPLRMVYEGHSGEREADWCFKALDVTVLGEQANPPRALATLHHVVPEGEHDYTLDASGPDVLVTTWHFEVDGHPVPGLLDNTCTLCPSPECDAHLPSPWTPDDWMNGRVKVCTPTVNGPDAGSPWMPDLYWEAPLDGIPPDSE